MAAGATEIVGTTSVPITAAGAEATTSPGISRDKVYTSRSYTPPEPCPSRSGSLQSLVHVPPPVGDATQRATDGSLNSPAANAGGGGGGGGRGGGGRFGGGGRQHAGHKRGRDDQPVEDPYKQLVARLMAIGSLVSAACLPAFTTALLVHAS